VKDHYLYQRALAHESKGDLDRAIVEYTAMVDSCQGFYLYHAIRGDAYFRNGDYDLAIADFTAVFENNTFFFEAIPLRGRAYQKINEFERAIEDYVIFLMAYPGHGEKKMPKLKEILACVSPDSPAAVCAKKQLSLSEAASEYYKINNELPPDHIALGSVHEARGEFDEAVAAYTAVLDNCPEHYLVKYYRGITYLKKGDYDLAIADFDDVLVISPRYPEVLSRRGRAYHLKNEFERAIEDYKAFITLCPGSTKISRMLQDALNEEIIYDK